MAYLTRQDLRPDEQYRGMYPGMDRWKANELDGLGSWWNPASWSWLVGSEKLKDPWGTTGETVKGGGLFSWLGKAFSGGSTFFDTIQWTQFGKSASGYITKESDGNYYMWDKDRKNKVFVASQSDVDSGKVKVGSAREGQGWLAKLFGAAGTVGKWAWNTTSKNWQAVGANENPSWAGTPPSGTQIPTTTPYLTQSQMIPGFDNTTLMVMGSIALVAFMALRRKGGSQQPIIIQGTK